MRRFTRSYSGVDANGGRGTPSRRSLRSTHIDEFYEIPTNFRARSPRTPAAPEKIAEKSPPTRRSLRLNTSSDIDADGKSSTDDTTPSKTRKRRFSSCPGEMASDSVTRRGRATSAKDVNGSESGPRPSKLMHIDESLGEPIKDSDAPTCFSNGVCSRTRLKREYQKENGTSDVSDEESAPSSGTPKKSATKDSKISDGCIRSPKENGIEDNSKCPSTPRQTRVTRSHRVESIENSTPVSKSENLETSLNKCVCNTIQKIQSGPLCSHCGKPASPCQRKNGSIRSCQQDKPLVHDGGGGIAHSLRSGRASMSPEYAASPAAAEEAGSKCLPKVNGNEPHSHCQRRKSRRLSERGEPFSSGSSDPEEATGDGWEKPTRPKADTHTGDSHNDETSKNVSTQSLKETQPTSPFPDSEPCDKNHNQPDTDIENKSVDQDGADAGVNEKRSHDSSSILEEFACGGLDLSSLSDTETDSLTLRKRRRMNLRSSGVRCDPDFYTLSLDLMIKKPALRKHLHCDMESSRPTSNSRETPRKGEGGLSEQGKDEAERAATKANSDNRNGSTVRVASDNDIKSLFTNIPDSQNTDTLSTCSSETPENSTVTSTTHAPSTPRVGGAAFRKVTPRSRGRGPKGLVSAKLDKPSTVRMVLPDPSEPPPLFAEELPSGPDVYFFESDHVALKHNKDYHELLHVVSLLESQRHQCLRDIESLEKGRDTASEEPIAFVEKLQKQVKVDLPRQQNVPHLPEIEWSKYSSVYGTFDHVFSQDYTVSPKKPHTRKVKINFETGVPMQAAECSSGKSRGKGKGDGLQGEGRSRTFNIPWTVEEQRLLEELLQKHPTEEIEFNRYRKIASALGNRTALQVQSRVQKYFLKLAKAGLPIPGHMPRLERYVGGAGRTKKARPHPHMNLTKMSTFFPTFHVPVRMQDDGQESASRCGNDDDDGGGWTIDQDQVSDEEDVSQEMRYSDEYLEILRLKRMRRERLRVGQNGQQALAQHVGYECDMCNCDPIQGVRYHCIDCPTDDGVDLCQSCIRLQGQFETETHKTSHRMEPVYKADNFMDDDYVKFLSRSGEYNYLDPNFFPPNT